VKQDLRVCAEWDVLYGLEEEQPMSHSYKDLIVWREAKSLASTVYRATEGFPKREWYGITSQIRRAAVSVPSNIAEGQGRLTKGEFVQFLGHARGSLQEMRTQLEIAVGSIIYLRRNYRSSMSDLSTSRVCSMDSSTP
jgi:four helix bundle protein